MHYENLLAFIPAAIDCIKILAPAPVRGRFSIELPSLEHMLLMLINPFPVYPASQTLFLFLYSLTGYPIKAYSLSSSCYKIKPQRALMIHTTSANQLPVDKQGDVEQPSSLPTALFNKQSQSQALTSQSPSLLLPSGEWKRPHFPVDSVQLPLR